MLKKNLNNIIFILQQGNNNITTGKLAILTKINYKNIGRYLNILEGRDLINREFYQVKKKRFILNSLTEKGEMFQIPFFIINSLKF
jgi:DNA-binding MarR family transcriptional regulator